MQTELTGLLTLCKLQSSHVNKVRERPYFNIVTIIQKVSPVLERVCRRRGLTVLGGGKQFPWYQPETYNSQQIVRLFNTACGEPDLRVEVLELLEADLYRCTAAVEILMAIRSSVPEWLDILTVLVSDRQAPGDSHSDTNLPECLC